jgi:serine O-acetyltransferase
LPQDVWSRLRADAAGHRLLAATLGRTALAAEAPSGLAALLDLLIGQVWIDQGEARGLAEQVLREAPDATDAALADLDAITQLNFEPGGLAGTWIGGRGFHMLLAHRVAHALWRRGDHGLAMAWKTASAALGADIHPAARFGRGIFLDHGIGVVIGETAVIEDSVCLWHGVTLGSTLMHGGDRHPKIRRGAVLGAAATILGAIEVGEGAVIASGSVVLATVPPHTTVAGNPARAKTTHRHPYGYAAAKEDPT